MVTVMNAIIRMMDVPPRVGQMFPQLLIVGVVIFGIPKYPVVPMINVIINIQTLSVNICFIVMIKNVCFESI